MRKQKRYDQTFFSPDAIRDAFNALEIFVREHPTVAAQFGEDPPALKISYGNMTVSKGNEKITYDNEEEFFADYRKAPEIATFGKYIGSASISVHHFSKLTDVEVECSARQAIEAAFERFEEHAPSSRLPEPLNTDLSDFIPPSPKIFIGHGRSPAWRELKEHLTDKHRYEVIAYEVGARAGHTVRDILEDMLIKSSIAFLVLTGEDRDDDGSLHARENVIHETGLFQGRLGFSRGIVLLEEGTVEFSNIHGIEQLRFSRGNIKEVFGDVVAVIKREFSSDL